MDGGARLIPRLRCLRSRFNSRSWEEKIIHTACLVIVLLWLPFFAKSYSSLFIGVTYAAIVLPTFISANYRYPPTPLKHLIAPLSDVTSHIMSYLTSPFLCIERTLFSLPNMFSLLSQLSFFSLCDRLLLSEHKISSLYTLIFYNVLTYCVSYLTEIVTKDWQLYVTVSDTSSLKHLSLTVTNIVLEWAKAVTFLITVVFLLLVFTLEQALDKYLPTKLYLAVTFLHYVATEKFFVAIFPRVLAWFELDSLDGLEDFYSPLILRLFSLTLSTLVGAASLLCGRYAAIPLCAYLNIVLAYRYAEKRLTPALREEVDLLKPYRRASPQELKAWNDICPICLSALTLPRTRVTPCFHLFHGDCLRKYLRARVWDSVCPMCKKGLNT